MSYEVGYFYSERNYRAVCANLYAAVYYESGYPDGTGVGQQFWNCGYGGICGSSED